VVPFPPGSATDTIARAFGGAVSQSLGQPVLVENKAGADGAISGAEVMRAPSDGDRYGQLDGDEAIRIGGGEAGALHDLLQGHPLIGFSTGRGRPRADSTGRRQPGRERRRRRLS
ncbi:MAG TPA: tripartite tricarboxylate transporter substrate-binding protein, partial [Quisquiliibacterium sp.]|nr:tripartite tricarboxylate transporter substrate-binding protein [Quisquiliibacterium sp.]